MLKVGKRYRSNGGGIVSIGGLTRENKKWVWSIQGHWYDIETGAFVGMGKKCQRVLLPTSNWRSISNHTPTRAEE